jgi:hypothetical protein
MELTPSFLELLHPFVPVFTNPTFTTFVQDDTLCRRRGLILYGAGMHHDPLISSRAKPLVSWGHDWVVLCIVIVNPVWAPTKVFALPEAVRLYPNRQELTKGKTDLFGPARSEGLE